MKKLQYIQPQVEALSVCPDASVMLLNSGDHPDAPKRGIAPEVPGESL